MLAVLDGAHHDVFSDRVATDQLNHDVDIRVVDHIGHVFGGFDLSQLNVRVRVTHRNLLDNNLPTGTACNIFRIVGQYVECTATYCTSTTDTYFYRFQDLISCQVPLT